LLKLLPAYQNLCLNLNKSGNNFTYWVYWACRQLCGV